jgi:hypothetical protein
MSAEVFLWWALLCAVSAINVVAWSFSAAVLRRRQRDLSAEIYAMRRLQLLLSAGYVLGCAFRSCLPVFDVPRLCLFDSWLSSVVVGRSVATFAELCFVTQWALLLREVSRATDSLLGITAAAAMVPLIIVAESCSWYSVLTTSNLGHVFEESIWAACAALLVTSLITIWPRSNRAQRPLLAATCVAGVVYVGFMFMVDVPMYWSRWIADESSGRTYLDLAQGLMDVTRHWIVSHRWDDWKHETVWMSLYFSVAVWISIALVHVPAMEWRATSVARKRARAASARTVH